jgi:hypothetical protein
MLAAILPRRHQSPEDHMKKLLTVVCTLAVCAGLSLAQATGSSTGTSGTNDTAGTTTTKKHHKKSGDKTTSTAHHKSGKKKKDSGDTTTTPK